MEPLRLRELIVSAKAGDGEAIAGLMDAYGPRLYGFFVRSTGNHHDAEDLLSELSIRLLRRLEHYDDRGRFEPWLFRIAANLIRDRIRRLRARPTAASLSGEDGGSMEARLPGEQPGVDAGLLAAEAGQQVRAALDRLDAPTREMILLRHFGELSFKEIAELCDAPMGTVLARVHRGLKKLRALLENRDATE